MEPWYLIVEFKICNVIYRILSFFNELYKIYISFVYGHYTELQVKKNITTYPFLKS